MWDLNIDKMRNDIMSESNITFRDLGLSDAMLKALEAKGYGWPTTIQAESIPHFMQWRDVIAKAPTGTGKTFAFGIPMIEHIDAQSDAVQGLILAPTRELAIQIGDELRSLLTYYQNIRVAVLYGGAGIGGQIKSLERKPQIVVATPGRLMDHYNRKTIRFDKIHTVVLDEADRMLDMVPGRSAQVLREWMQARGGEFTRRVGVVAMDAFAGWKQAVESVVPHAVEVIDPFHVVQLAAARVTKVRCRLQRDATGRRGVKGDRLYDCRRALLTSDEYLGARGRARLMTLFAIQTNHDLMLAHDAYQRVIHAYRCDDRRRGERMMRELIDDLTGPGRYKGCRELASLGRVLKRRMRDILALFRHPHSSNGPTEAINGRLETLRGNAMGFANTTSYIQRCLIHSSQLKDILTH